MHVRLRGGSVRAGLATAGGQGAAEGAMPPDRARRRVAGAGEKRGRGRFAIIPVAEEWERGRSVAATGGLTGLVGMASVQSGAA